jgi:hypothetical protein
VSEIRDGGKILELQNFSSVPNFTHAPTVP